MNEQKYQQEIGQFFVIMYRTKNKYNLTHSLKCE